MGFKTKSNERVVYANVQQGKFRIKVKAETEGAVERTNKIGEKVYEKLYEELEGFITNIEYEKSDHKGTEYESLVLSLTDEDGEKSSVKTLWGSKACKSFIARVDSIDFTQQVTLSVFEMPREDDPTKKDTFLLPKQHGERISPNYGFNTPNPWPVPGKVKVSGKIQPDYTAQLELMQEIVDRVKIKLEREAKQAVKLPTSEGGRYDAPVAHKQAEGKYNAATDFDRPSAVADAVDAGGDDYESDLPF